MVQKVEALASEASAKAFFEPNDARGRLRGPDPGRVGPVYLPIQKVLAGGEADTGLQHSDLSHDAFPRWARLSTPRGQTGTLSADCRGPEVGSNRTGEFVGLVADIDRFQPRVAPKNLWRLPEGA
jgi:hypothetical protein